MDKYSYSGQFNEFMNSKLMLEVGQVYVSMTDTNFRKIGDFIQIEYITKQNSRAEVGYIYGKSGKKFGEGIRSAIESSVRHLTKDEKIAQIMGASNINQIQHKIHERVTTKA